MSNSSTEVDVHEDSSKLSVLKKYFGSAQWSDGRDHVRTD